MKKIKKIICLLLAISIGMENCFAVSASFLSQLVSTEGGGGEGEETPFSDWFTYNTDTGNKVYQYRYKKEKGTATTISINAYDLEGKSVIPNSVTVAEGKTFKAGTWLGINTTETHGASWRVYDFEYKEARKKHKCKYQADVYKSKEEEKTISGISESACQNKIMNTDNVVPGSTNFTLYSASGTLGDCKYKVKTWYYWGTDTETYEQETDYNDESFSCPDGHPDYYYYDELIEYTTVTILYDTSNSTFKNKMREEAVASVRKWAMDSIKWSNGSVKYITNDSYPNNPEDLTYNTINEGSENSYYVDKITLDTPNEVKGYAELEYEILENKVCMNLKTAKVIYGRDCDPDDNEIQIKTGKTKDTKWLDKDGNPRNVNYWHYFIPLNAKSNSEFTLDIVKNESRIFSKSECEQFMEDEADYVNYIVPLGENDVYIGDYNKHTDKSLSVDYNKLIEDNGCNISTKIVFPISQEFYKETVSLVDGEDTKLKGFNFYYKPIDIDNPFPNGIAENSLWKKWSDEPTKKPDISKSYNKATYTAKDINARKIREYNKSNNYTSWETMTLTGKSTFITKENIVTREPDTGSVYRLGCGPANANEFLDAAKTIKNFLYREECS